MKDERQRTALRVCECCLVVTTLLAAALFIVQCASIYIEGTSPANIGASGERIHDIYSVEIVGRRFAQMSWALLLWVVTGAAVLVARRLAPAEKRAASIPIENRVALQQGKVQQTPLMQQEEKKRKTIARVGLGFCVVCGVRVAVYLLTPGNFVSRDMEMVMGAFLRAVAPWIVVGFAGLCVLAVLYDQSFAKTLAEIQNAPKMTKPVTAQPCAEKAGSTKPFPNGWRVALYLAAIALVIAGIMNGGMFDVLVKAINICTECIGLG